MLSICACSFRFLRVALFARILTRRTGKRKIPARHSAMDWQTGGRGGRGNEQNGKRMNALEGFPYAS